MRPDTKGIGTKQNKRRSRAMLSDIEGTIEVMEIASVAPQSKRLEVSSHLKERIVATKVPAITATAGERPAMLAPTASHITNGTSTAAANAQIKVLIDLIKSLLKALTPEVVELVGRI
jgi:hypothetical protein